MDKHIYLAGIVDGEGHFDRIWHKNGRGELHKYPRLVINQKDERLIDWLKQHFGGCKSVGKDKRRDADYRIFRWELKGSKVTELAQIIQPYLIVKQEQVKLVLK